MRVIINGARGKMGSLAAETLKDQPKIELVGLLGREDNLAETIKKTRAQVVIDLTSAESVYANTLTIMQNNARPIIGSTGLSHEEIHRLQQFCLAYKVGGIIAPSFSIAALLMMRFAREAAHYFEEAQIIEYHHAQKKDAPSGTAIKTASLIAEVRENKPVTSKALIPGALGANSHTIPIHSIRLPGFLAHQEVIFGEMGETLTIRHDSTDRRSFMPGLLLACEKILSLKELIYGLDTLLT